MKSISFYQKCFQALVLLALLATTAFAQPGGNHNPIPGGGTPKPSDGKDPDFDIVGFVIEGGTTVVREKMINATITLKNKGGELKKGNKVKLWYIPDMEAYKKDQTKNKIEVRDIEFNKDNEAVVHVEFAGYTEATTNTPYLSRAIVNPESSIAESSYTNNDQDISVTVNPHKVEIDVTFDQVHIIHDLDVGEGEFRMNMKIGKKNKDGVVTWITPTQWFPSETGYIQVDEDLPSPDYKVAKFIKIKDVSEEDYIVFETNAVEDDVNYNDNMGKCKGQFAQIKAWPDKTAVGSTDKYNIKSDLGHYSVYATAKIVTVN